MNIENIAALAAQLQSLGFDNLGSGLLKRICLRPQKFILTEKIIKNGDQYIFHLLFEKDHHAENYYLRYYDAILQKEIVLPVSEINGISLTDVESKMSELDWKIAFDLTSKKQWAPTDKASWEKELKIDTVVHALEQLETTEEGKAFATTLKLKYWAGIPYQEFFGNLIPIKNKADVNQRFYFSEGQPGIAVDEAIRFLQNRWFDKQMQSKRKSQAEANADNLQEENNSSSGDSLLKKNKRNGSSPVRKNSKV